MRETGERRPGSVASLRPAVGVPPEARPTFLSILPSLVALWGLTGFYLSLAPGLIGSVEGSPNRLWGGAAVFCICFSGGAAVVFLREATARTAMLAGCVALFAGVLAALYSVSYTMFSVPIVIAGVAETHFSAHDVALVFSGGVAVLAAVGIAASLSERGLVARRARVTPPGS